MKKKKTKKGRKKEIKRKMEDIVEEKDQDEGMVSFFKPKEREEENE